MDNYITNENRNGKNVMDKTVKRPKILIVEDEIIIAMDLQFTLENLGYAFSEIVSSGEESIEKVSRLLPDVVLMDVKLSGLIDGVKAAERIYRRFRIPIIYVSAYSDEQTLKRMNRVKNYGYLNKPFEERELKKVLEKALKDSPRFNN